MSAWRREAPSRKALEFSTAPARHMNAQLDTVLEPDDTILGAGRTADAEGFGQVV